MREGLNGWLGCTASSAEDIVYEDGEEEDEAFWNDEGSDDQGSDDAGGQLPMIASTTMPS